MELLQPGTVLLFVHWSILLFFSCPQKHLPAVEQSVTSGVADVNCVIPRQNVRNIQTIPLPKRGTSKMSLRQTYPAVRDSGIVFLWFGIRQERGKLRQPRSS